jgi:hypothetical protein
MLSEQELATLKQVDPPLPTQFGGHAVVINAHIFRVR